MNPNLGEGWKLIYEETRKVNAVNCEISCRVRLFESNRLEPLLKPVAVTIYDTWDKGNEELDEIPPLAALFPIEIGPSEGFPQIRQTVKHFDALCRDAKRVARGENYHYFLDGGS